MDSATLAFSTALISAFKTPFISTLTAILISILGLLLLRWGIVFAWNRFGGLGKVVGYNSVYSSSAGLGVAFDPRDQRAKDAGFEYKENKIDPVSNLPYITYKKKLSGMDDLFAVKI